MNVMVSIVVELEPLLVVSIGAEPIVFAGHPDEGRNDEFQSIFLEG